MDKLSYLREQVRRILSEYATIPYSFGDLRHETVYDDAQGRYIVLSSGWENGKPVQDIVIRIDLIGDKVWLQCDNTDAVIADELIAAGIPSSDIVLGFHEPAIRPYTGFAVA